MSNLDYSSQVAKIKVFGVGGAGTNAVNRMVEEGLQGVDFYVANTDLQSLTTSPIENKIQLGQALTNGRGAGHNPEVGFKAAQENEDEIRELMKDTDMVFITAGMGGGTGTGAAPIFAKIAKEVGALTVAIVTTPFSFEGKKTLSFANEGLAKLREHVDSIIIVSNNQLLQVIGHLPISDSFKEADNVLRQGVQTITDLTAIPATINIDFADVKSTMQNQGNALIGIGLATGEDKALEAAKQAIQSPLLEAKIDGAKNAIVNVTGGMSMSLFEADTAVNFITEAAGGDIDIIFGVAMNESLDDAIIVTVIATGFDTPDAPVQTELTLKPQPTKIVKNDTAVEIEVEDLEDNEIPSFIRSRGR
ncbi:MAG: cell division protein FtsZ [Erysipelothrix sp.]|nr:cell division protein FtsZ [Erysipelothrix sp.]